MIPTSASSLPAPSRTHATSRLTLIAFLLPLAIYVLPHRYHGSGDTVPAELLPIALLHGHGLALNEFAPPNQDLPYYLHNSHGRIISSYPVVPGLLNVPVYTVASLFHVDLVERRSRLSLISSAILCSLSVLFVFLTLQRMIGDQRIAFWFALLYAFGTNAWSNGGTALFQHGPSLFFLTGALYCLVRNTPQSVPWAGLLLGLAVWNRPTNIVFALPLTIYVLLHRRRSLFPFACLAAIPAILLGIYSQLYWGSIRMLGQGQGGWGFDGHVLAGLAGLLVSPSRGLLIFTPVFIFGIIEGFRRIKRENEDPLLTYLFVSALLLIALYTKWGMWWGGHSFSYRILTEVCPAFILLAAAAWRSWVREHPARRRLFYAAAFLSVFIQALGIWPYPSGFNDGIDTEPSRLWNWKESELTMGVTKLLARYHLRRYRLQVHHIGSGSAAESSRSPYHIWWNPANNDDSIPGWYDSPTDQQVVHGPLLVDGWAKSAAGAVDVRVILDDGQKVMTPDRYARPDVAVALPELGDVSHAGWKTWFSYTAGGPPVHTVTIEFRAPNGHVRALPPLHFRWEPR